MGEIAVTNTSDYTRALAGDGFSAYLYPNPAFSFVNVEVKGSKGPYNIMVTNLQGAVLWKAEGLTDRQVKIPLSNLAQGVYMVMVTDKVHTGTLKLVKQ